MDFFPPSTSCVTKGVIRVMMHVSPHDVEGVFEDGNKYSDSLFHGVYQERRRTGYLLLQK